MHESRKCRKYRLEKLQICTGWFITIVGWEALHMKKNYDDEQENTTAYRVRLLRQDRGLMKIIRDVKENMAEEQPSGAVATAEAVKGIRAALPDKPQSELTADDVSTAITAYIGTMITMDENTSELFQ